MSEARVKSAVRSAQGGFGFHAQPSRGVDYGEDEVAQLAFALRIGLRRFQLAQFLRRLLEDARVIVPVEPHPRRPALNGLGVSERRHDFRDAVEDGALRPLHFLALDLVPSRDGVGGVRHLGVPEHVGMPPNELVDDPAAHLRAAETPIRFGDFGLEDDMKQDVAHLFDYLVVVPFLYRLHELIALFEKEMLERVESLLAVPRAAVGAKQGGYDLSQAVKVAGEAVGVRQDFLSYIDALACDGGKHIRIGIFRGWRDFQDFDSSNPDTRNQERIEAGGSCLFMGEG